MDWRDTTFIVTAVALLGVVGVTTWARSPLRVNSVPHTVDAEIRADDHVQVRDGLARVNAPDAAPHAVVVVAVDGLRPQDIEEMPALKALGPVQVLRASSPDPVSAQAAVLTGLPPSLSRAYIGDDGRARPLGAQAVTLGWAFSKQGWVSVGLTAERRRPARRSGFDRGFDVWLGNTLLPGEDVPYVQADRLLELAAVALQERPDAFVYVHLADPATPWVPRSEYLPEPVKGRYLETYVRTVPFGASFRAVSEDLSNGVPLAPEVLETWTSAQQGEVAYLDAALQVFIEQLPPDAWIIVVGTHGQQIGDRGQLGASTTLHDDGLQVGLVARGPELRGARLTADVPRLLVDELDFEVDLAAPGPAVSELLRPMDEGPPARAFYQGPRKLWVQGDHVLAHDLSADPKEEAPLQDPEWAAPMHANAVQWIETLTGPGADE
jgi:hypothetical protein